MTLFALNAMIIAVPNRDQGAVTEKAVSHSLRKGVMRMGPGRGMRILRFLVCLFVILWIMVYISPKAC